MRHKSWINNPETLYDSMSNDSFKEDVIKLNVRAKLVY